MKRSMIVAGILFLTFTSPVLAAPKTYQVTGPVVALTADTLTVQKGSEKWEIARGTADVPSDVKVGSKVTVKYSMTAASVTAKEDKTASTPSTTTK